MTYIKITLKREITIHYFEYMKDFVFHGESHDFWEFLYVDREASLYRLEKIISGWKPAILFFMNQMNFSHTFRWKFFAQPCRYVLCNKLSCHEFLSGRKISP